jgi:hypothetical protein
MSLTFYDELYSLMNVSDASTGHLFYRYVIGLADLFLRPKLQLLYLTRIKPIYLYFTRQLPVAS